MAGNLRGKRPPPELLDKPYMRAAMDRLLAEVAKPGATLALDRLLSKKPLSLILAQRESFDRLHERLLELGWSPDRLVVNPESGCISVRRDEGSQIIFLQAAEDDRVRERFCSFRKTLPPNLRIQSWPLDRVGAMATLDLQGFAGFGTDETQDFVAISSGIMKFGAWGLAVSKSCGQHMGRQVPTESSGVEEPPRSWWQESLRPLAFDILGCTVDLECIARIMVYDMMATDSLSIRHTMTTLMNGFLFFHEIGHHECGHGGVHRALGVDREPNSDQCSLMEAEADAFAVEHLLGLADRKVVASSLSLVFLLFAMSPELLVAYPWCHDQQTHPHPLTRLVWVMRRLFPEDHRTQAEYINFVISILVQGGSWGADSEHMELAIRYSVMGKGPSPIA